MLSDAVSFGGKHWTVGRYSEKLSIVPEYIQCRSTLVADINNAINIDNANWLPTKTDPSTHAPGPSATLTINTFGIIGEAITSSSQISRGAMLVRLSLALLCFIICAGGIRIFKRVWATHKLSVGSGANVVETADAQTATIETADAGTSAIETINSGTVAIDTADVGMDAIKTINSAMDSVETADAGTEAIETINSGTDAVETINSGTDAIETISSATDFFEAADSGTNAVETINSGTDAVNTINPDTNTVETINSGADTDETASFVTDATETVTLAPVPSRPRFWHQRQRDREF
ncbi:hypothetical protein GGH12_003465 [Coemansia sp. RSA 1822]|nr:hypothetical protein GGH12_003465 [Coemansia sp. RSA 1822]